MKRISRPREYVLIKLIRGIDPKCLFPSSTVEKTIIWLEKNGYLIVEKHGFTITGKGLEYLKWIKEKDIYRTKQCSSCHHYVKDEHTHCDNCLENKYSEFLERTEIQFMGTSYTEPAYLKNSVLDLIRHLTGE